MVSSEILGQTPSGDLVRVFTITTPRARLRLMERRGTFFSAWPRSRIISITLPATVPP